MKIVRCYNPSDFITERQWMLDYTRRLLKDEVSEEVFDHLQETLNTNKEMKTFLMSFSRGSFMVDYKQEWLTRYLWKLELRIKDLNKDESWEFKTLLLFDSKGDDYDDRELLVDTYLRLQEIYDFRYDGEYVAHALDNILADIGDRLEEY